VIEINELGKDTSEKKVRVAGDKDVVRVANGPAESGSPKDAFMREVFSIKHEEVPDESESEDTPPHSPYSKTKIQFFRDGSFRGKDSSFRLKKGPSFLLPDYSSLDNSNKHIGNPQTLLKP